MNISLGPNEDRHLMSGLHTVNNIYCSSWQLAADTGLEICKFDRILYSLCRLQVHVLLQSAYVDLDLFTVTRLSKFLQEPKPSTIRSKPVNTNP